MITRISDQWEIIVSKERTPLLISGTHYFSLELSNRGMGILGLSNLHYIVTHYPEQSRRFIEYVSVHGSYPF